MKKKAWLGAILVGGLAGCGGGGGSAPTVQMTGVVADWYIQDALIFADLNDDGIYQPETEPSTRSGTGGGYQLHVTSDRPYYLISKGGIDTSTSQYFVKSSTSELALSTHVFGDDDEGDRVYMGDVQDAQDQTIALIIQNASVTGLVPTIQVEGDDDKDEYEH